MSAIQKHFHMLLQNMIREFSSTPAADFSSTEEKHFTDVTSDPTVRLRFKAKKLAVFWIGVGNDPPLSNPAEPLSELSRWFFNRPSYISSAVQSQKPKPPKRIRLLRHDLPPT